MYIFINTINLDGDRHLQNLLLKVKSQRPEAGTTARKLDRILFVLEIFCFTIEIQKNKIDTLVLVKAGKRN